jgi:hypothetical protein
MFNQTKLALIALACVFLSNFLWVSQGDADVGGSRQVLYRQHQIFGNSTLTGNSLMRTSLANPLVNSFLLDQSSGDVSGIPFDATLEGAYLFWTGSLLNNTPDRTIDLTLPDGTFLNNVFAEQCSTVSGLGGFFSCRADVTETLRPHPGLQSYNGRYIAGDVQASAGTLNNNGQCLETPNCYAKYAAWSLVIVYSSPSANTLRDISLYDGFLKLDETEDSPGIDQFSINGFDFPQNGQASIAFFGLEGDSLLGVPPQDTDPIPTLRCSTCFDFFEVNGTKVSDPNNPPNNVFNSSLILGYTLGVDLDRFDISDLLNPGDQTIALRVGSGDGRVNPF